MYIPRVELLIVTVSWRRVQKRMSRSQVFIIICGHWCVYRCFLYPIEIQLMARFLSATSRHLHLRDRPTFFSVVHHERNGVSPGQVVWAFLPSADPALAAPGAGGLH